MAGGDFDGDRMTDVVFALPAGLALYRGDGSGGITATSTVATAAGADALSTGDINRDGIADIAAGRSTTQNGAVFVFTGGATAPHLTLALENTATAVNTVYHDAERPSQIVLPIVR